MRAAIPLSKLAASLVSLSISLMLAAPATAWLTPVERGSGGSDAGNAAAVAPNGDLFIAGNLALPGGGGSISIARLAAGDGTVLWKGSYRPADGIFGQARSIAIDAAGDVVAGGYITRAGNTFTEIAVVKRNGTTGAELWHYKPDALCYNYGFFFVVEAAQAVAVDADGDVFVAGHYVSCDARGIELVVVKLRGSDGAVLWRKDVNDTVTGNLGDFANALAIDADGNAVVGGQLKDSFGVVLELDGNDGSERWRRKLDTAPFLTGSGGTVRAIALDTSGNVFATGFLPMTGGPFPIVKVNGGTGAIEWTGGLGNAGCDGTPSSGGYALAVAPDGDPVVAGLCVYPGQVLVRRYDGATGSTADWTHTPGHLGAYNAIAFDAAGDVLLTGHRSFSDTTYLHVRKLGGTTGTVAWTVEPHSYTGSFPEEWGRAVLPLASGDLYLAGTITPAYAEPYDMVGIRLRGSDGTHVGCGDGTISGAEQCEDGNFVSNDCCDTFCKLDPSGTVCRASTGVCDPAETCDGVTTICPGNAFSPAGTACPDDGQPCTTDVCNGTGAACTHPAGNTGVSCRAAADPICDVAETCDGASTSCPADVVAPVGTPCADDGSLCTVDACNGPYCYHTPGNAGLECRAAGGVCDVAETCNGFSSSCPFDAKVPNGTSCRASTGVCDPAETCNGISATCPNDVLLPSGTECRASAGVCDAAETCDGTHGPCPADGRVPSGTVCRGSAGICDPTEQCDGSAVDCPANVVDPIGTPCDDGDTCTDDDACDAGGQCVGGTDTCNDCCSEHAAPSCGISGCNTCICNGGDGYCCNNQWDELCTQRAATTCQSACGCLPPPPVCPGGSSDPTDCTNRYVCYKTKTTKETAKFAPIDPLNIVPRVTVLTVTKPKELCLSADTGGGVASPNVHQERYQVKSTFGFPPSGSYQDEFGTRVYILQKPEALLQPTATALGSDPALPAPAAADSYLCYKAKLDGSKFPRGVQITATDAFETNRIYDVKKPVSVCVPVDTGDREVNLKPHMVCYQVKLAKGQPKHVPVVGQIHATNQFGHERLDSGKQGRMCVPALRLP